MKNAAHVIIAILICAAIAAGLYCTGKRPPVVNRDEGVKDEVLDTTGRNKPPMNSYPNFTSAAKAVTPGVVHIKSTYGIISGPGMNQQQLYERNAPSISSGSGVIIAANGYIATNNHVVENATQIEVILTDRRQFIAKLVGRDPNTDLALLKIEASGLPVVKIGNSDVVEVGEWVLAVGYPYSLNTTVTAGIISAKGRSIGIIGQTEGGGNRQRPNSAIESFIQTDAAINAGNSGGALVNTKGELIGINTAIASLTGSYAGYAFSIPVNLAKKILDDIREFGTVKRGILGVAFAAPGVEDQYLKQKGIEPGSVQGVFITGIQSGSAADSSGLKEGDIIQTINGIPIVSSSEFSERIARHRPGDKITLKFLRNKKSEVVTVTLKEEATGKVIAHNAPSLEEIYNKLGARFSPLTPALRERFSLEAGILVTAVLKGGFFDQVGIPPGTIIAYINGRVMHNPKTIEDALMAAQNTRIQILAIAPDGSRVAFNFSFGA